MIKIHFKTTPNNCGRTRGYQWKMKKTKWSSKVTCRHKNKNGPKLGILKLIYLHNKLPAIKVNWLLKEIRRIIGIAWIQWGYKILSIGFNTSTGHKDTQIKMQVEEGLRRNHKWAKCRSRMPLINTRTHAWLRTLECPSLRQRWRNTVVLGQQGMSIQETDMFSRRKESYRCKNLKIKEVKGHSQNKEVKIQSKKQIGVRKNLRGSSGVFTITPKDIYWALKRISFEIKKSTNT